MIRLSRVLWSVYATYSTVDVVRSDMREISTVAGPGRRVEGAGGRLGRRHKLRLYVCGPASLPRLGMKIVGGAEEVFRVDPLDDVARRRRVAR